MRKSPGSLALDLVRLGAIVAMGFSVALVVDATRAAPAFCVTGSGCDLVRKSGYGSLGGIPVPYVGLLAYAVVFVLTMSREKARKIGASAAIAGGAVAIALLALQAFVIHAFCTLCLGVDLSAIIAAGGGILYLRSKEPTSTLLPGISWAALVLGALFGPVAAGTMVPSTTAPEDVRSFWKPGFVNVVEFSDFECPFCRMNHPELEKAKKAAGAKVHFTRVSFPLAGHPHARPATRAYLCAVEQGKGEEMAHELFTVDPPSAENARIAAEKLGLDDQRLRACLADPKTEARIEADMALVRRAEFKGLPTTWIDDRKLLGTKSAAEIGATIDAAAAGGASGRGPGVFLSFLALIVGAFLYGLRRGFPDPPAPRSSND